MQNNTIVNIVIGASSLKVIHCEKRDTDIIIKNSVILETGSNLYLNKDTLNIGFIEDKLRIFFFENKIRNGKICFILPDYMMVTKIVNKQQILTNDYITGLIKTKQLHELIDENIPNEEDLVFDCQVINKIKFNTRDDNDGSTDVMVSYIKSSIVRSLKQMSKRLKMVPSVLESETSGYLRLINMFEIKENYMLIDIGEIYTKIIIYCGTSSTTPSIEYQVSTSGVYTIDSLISKLFRCPPIMAAQRRFAFGLNTENEVVNNILSDVVKDVFGIPIIEHLNNIQNTYGGMHFINKFLISGGAWNIPGFKSIIENNTLGLYSSTAKFEDFSSFTSSLTFDNDIVKDDILTNINSYASCVGLCLRGGI